MLSDYEVKRITTLRGMLDQYRAANHVKQMIYEGKNRIKDMGISIPPQLLKYNQSSSWGKIAVDTLNNRVMVDGFTDNGDYGINEIFDQNSLSSEFPMCNKDAFRFGIGYCMVSNGNPDLGEPEVLVTAESPNQVVADYNPRTRRAKDAIHVSEEGDKLTFGTYLTDTEAIPFYIHDGNIFEDEEAERIQHNFGLVPVVPIVNRAETGSWKGHSEISEPVISAIEGYQRTLLGLEVAREFGNAPQRYVLGADESYFMKEDGETPRDGLSVLMDRMMVLPSDSEGKNPVVGQFQQGATGPYVDILRMYANIMASTTGISLSNFGFETVNPTSADAITASEVRLTKAAENFASSARRAYKDIAELMIIARDGFVPEGFRENVEPVFRDPRTPTRAAAADEVLKLVSSNILRPDSEIVYRRLGLSRAEIETIKAENNAISSASLIEQLRNVDVQEVEEEAPAIDIEKVV